MDIDLYAGFFAGLHAFRIFYLLPSVYNYLLVEELGHVPLGEIKDEFIDLFMTILIIIIEIWGVLIQPACLYNKKRGLENPFQRLIMPLFGKVKQVRDTLER